MSNIESVTVQFSREPGCEDVDIPQYQTPGSSGMDLHAAIDQPVTIQPGNRVLISAGFRMSLPEGYEAQVRPRSGLALKHGITVLNTPGTIDSDYRGVVGVILINLSEETFTVHRNDRIAQMVIQRVICAEIKVVETLDMSERHDGGFGSTGR